MAKVEFVVLGYVVKASVQGKNGPQQISQRYASRDAANTYRDLAERQGFKDAFVAEVTGLETAAKAPVQRKKREILPP